MISVFSALQHIPEIFYVNTTQEGTTVSGRLAHKLKEACESLKALKSTWPNQRPAQLIIVDRNIDPYSPLLHSLTYQSAIHDLMQVSRNRVTLHRLDDLNNSSADIVALDESDTVFVNIFSSEHVMLKGASHYN